MPNESCVQCGKSAEDDDRFTVSGPVHARCWDAFVSADESVEANRPMRILGALLRFLGMAVIIGSVILIFLSGGNDGGPLISALVGAGVHFAGRKIAPDAHWASATGGAVAGVGSIALIVAVILGFFFIISHPADVLGWVFAFLTGPL